MTPQMTSDNVTLSGMIERPYPSWAKPENVTILTWRREHCLVGTGTLGVWVGYFECYLSFHGDGDCFPHMLHAWGHAVGMSMMGDGLVKKRMTQLVCGSWCSVPRLSLLIFCFFRNSDIFRGCVIVLRSDTWTDPRQYKDTHSFKKITTHNI